MNEHKGLSEQLQRVQRPFQSNGYCSIRKETTP